MNNMISTAFLWLLIFAIRWRYKCQRWVDWTTAPEWTRWWAVDPDSICYWFDEEPIFIFGGWYVGDGRSEKAGYLTLPLGIDHRMTLIARPGGK